MRFRLTYEGELRPNQRDPAGNQPDRLADHKQSIRKEFHRQLRHLWATNKFLRSHKVYPKETPFSPAEQAQQPGTWGGGKDTRIPMVEEVASRYHQFGYRFVPLVREDLSLLCSLDILFLRRDMPGRPGSVISAGDLDNRIKTLIDTLRRPQSVQELRGHETPGPDEDPFYCLLEDDNLVTSLTVETDTLLLPPEEDPQQDQRKVHLIITVDLKPYDVNMFNLSFA